MTMRSSSAVGTVSGFLGLGAGCLVGALTDGMWWRVATIAAGNLSAFVVGWNFDRLAARFEKRFSRR